MKEPIFVVLVMGSWGKGTTLKEAGERCFKAGGRRKDYAVAKLILNGDDAYVTSDGYISHNGEMVGIGSGFSLSDILDLEL